VCIGTASITRSKTATAEAIFWQAIAAFVIRARTTSLDRRPLNVALARIKTGVPSQFLVTMPRDGAIIFADLIGKLNAPYKSGPSKAWLKIKNPKAPAATRAWDGTF
jgi:hypothetical protein